MAQQNCAECGTQQANGTGPETVRIGLFCPQCGRLLDRDSLRTIQLRGFVGRDSISPAMEVFNATGDPALAFPEREP